jgi:CTP synthase (UTP-ammonia lyase)
MAVDIRPDTTAAAAYGAASATERYYCNFGLNPDHIEGLVAGGLQVSGVDADGEVRIVELDGHPFFLATLFCFQTRSRAQAPHPLVAGFVAAAGMVHSESA